MGQDGQNGLTQILVAIHVGGDADLQQQAGDVFLQPLLTVFLRVSGHPGGDGHGACARRADDLLHQLINVDGLEHVVGGAQADGAHDEVVPAQRRLCNEARPVMPGQARQVLQQREAVHSGHNHVADQHLGMERCEQRQCFHAIAGLADNGDSIVRG